MLGGSRAERCSAGEKVERVSKGCEEVFGRWGGKGKSARVRDAEWALGASGSERGATEDRGRGCLLTGSSKLKVAQVLLG